jgi:hypothetical protein
MFIATSYRIAWDDLRKLAKEINNCLPNFYEDGPAIISRSRQDIYKEIKYAFDYLAENVPNWKDSRRIPAQAIELYESFTEQQIGSNDLFAKVPFRFIEEELDKLTVGEIKVLFGFLRYASISDGNRGETWVSNKKVAETVKVSFANINKIIGSLKTKGYLVNLRKHRSGSWVRQVKLG